MTFSERLNEYIICLDCTAKELSEASELSPSIISRYRKDSRVPSPGSEHLLKLSDGIHTLFVRNGVADAPDRDEILAELTATLQDDQFDLDLFVVKLNELIDAAEVSVSRLARSMNYDASYLSRVRTGDRHPADPAAFADGVCRFVSANCTGPDEIASIASLLGKPASVFADQRSYFNALRGWICDANPSKTDNVDHFLSKLDEFDLNDYIRSIRFNELKIPTVPFQFSTAKHYYGLEQMCAGELDFFKATVLSHAKENVFMCSDMDIADMAEVENFGKKWMFAIALCLKKGLHLDMIHTIDRPFDEMMLGLESWLPIYMTGQISPYYLKNARSEVYQHLNYVSGAAALTGECIAGHHKNGKYYLTKKPEEVAFYREKSNALLKIAQPLMEIYRSERQDAYREMLECENDLSCKRHGILTAPPIYTLPTELLDEILKENGISDDFSQEIRNYTAKMRAIFEKTVESNEYIDEIPKISREEFEAYPLNLSIEGLYAEVDVRYDYDRYLRHLAATEDAARRFENYTVTQSIRRAFRHIQIFIREGEYAIIAKSNAPTVHFVIRQPKLRRAIENIILPVVE